MRTAKAAHNAPRSDGHGPLFRNLDTVMAIGDATPEATSRHLFERGLQGGAAAAAAARRLDRPAATVGDNGAEELAVEEETWRREQCNA